MNCVLLSLLSVFILSVLAQNVTVEVADVRVDNQGNLLITTSLIGNASSDFTFELVLNSGVFLDDESYPTEPAVASVSFEGFDGELRFAIIPIVSLNSQLSNTSLSFSSLLINGTITAVFLTEGESGVSFEDNEFSFNTFDNGTEISSGPSASIAGFLFLSSVRVQTQGETSFLRIASTLKRTDIAFDATVAIVLQNTEIYDTFDLDFEADSGSNSEKIVWSRAIPVSALTNVSSMTIVYLSSQTDANIALNADINFDVIDGILVLSENNFRLGGSVNSIVFLPVVNATLDAVLSLTDADILNNIVVDDEEIDNVLAVNVTLDNNLQVGIDALVTLIISGLTSDNLVYNTTVRFDQASGETSQTVYFGLDDLAALLISEALSTVDATISIGSINENVQIPDLSVEAGADLSVVLVYSEGLFVIPTVDTGLPENK